MTPTRTKRTFRAAALFASAVVGATIAATLTPVPAARATAPLQVTTVASNLSIPWDVEVAPDGTILTAQRSGSLVAIRPDGRLISIAHDTSRIFAAKEAGAMGIALDPGFAQNRRVYICQAEYTRPGAPTIPGEVADLPLPWPNTGQVINVVSWRIDGDWIRANRERTVLSGIPITAAGRHAGCALTASGRSLWVGTGDAALPGNAQNRNSLGGKVLHINRDGTPAAGNPNPRSPIYTLGHRNVQGVAVAPGTGRVYAIEQGTDRDDELNLLRSGGNYGYRPDRAPVIYDESVPMTDPIRVPGAIGPVWRSGPATIATTALAFLPAGWGPYSGGLVVSTLKGKRLVFMKLSADGRRVVAKTEALTDRYGRLRGLAVAPDGSLLVTTSNGNSADKILRVRWGS
ncbi:PQQ-dependent sugar dehydrogenase [Gordonia bronchialis]|uniref:PQQ-dependent sugar dehydrogenase n=1 Tax=Gordonia bronchialis TaxID=2054 RepID=UPI0005A55637|nr:PQQ-dependent sugar dehydrogenase [Gordonia bronchialis]